MGAPVLLTEGPDAGLVSHLDNPNLEQRRIDSSWVGLGNRDILSVSGPDRLVWLHSLTTQFLEGLEPGRAITALVLSPTGHVEHLLRGVDDGKTFWAWTDAGRGPALVGWLDSMRFMMRVEVLAHPELRLVWTGRDVPPPDGVVSMDSEVAGGHELLLPDDAGDPRAPQAGVRAWEASRIEAGVPRIGLDTDERTIPNEIGLYGTHLDKGCYRGQETVARVHTMGRPPRRLTRLTLDGSGTELPEPGAEITLEGRRVGVLGSVAVHHEDGPIALCLLRRSTDPEATLDVAGVTAGQEILVDPQVGLHVRPIL
ncbi:YgfZ/GcvT domain-containing protein [Acidipropionibacterium virtanenii]|uniref:tRNA-modifying protein YgfZ n=1 Tax=Acidipropionibacterium virtanenii TaxID=2057246 RepID=A0A344URP2_9ACTN|nr:folate-binding protein YgfZ [Acidipropionibacterium virtanenii]AXE37940.1 tRNA-modifying protein YgfZ [Acidipropionibacterium virtanenii]